MGFFFRKVNSFSKYYVDTMVINFSIIVNGLIGLLFWFWIEQFFQLEDISKSTLLINSLLTVTSFSRLGLDVNLIRIFNSEPKEKRLDIIRNLFSLTLFSSFTFSTISFIFLVASTNIREIKSFDIFFTFVVFAFLWSLELVGDSYFIAVLKPKYYFLRNFSFNISKFAFAIIFSIIDFGGTWSLYYAWGFALLIGFFIMGLNVWKNEKKIPNPRVDIRMYIDLIGPSIKIFIGRQLTQAFPFFVPIILINQNKGNFVYPFFVAWLILNLIVQMLNSTSSIFLANLGFLESHTNPTVQKQTVIMMFIILVGSLFSVPILRKVLEIIYASSYVTILKFSIYLIMGTPFVAFLFVYQTKLIHNKQFSKFIFINAMHMIFTFIIIFITNFDLDYLIGSWSIGAAIVSFLIIIEILLNRLLLLKR